MKRSHPNTPTPSFAAIPPPPQLNRPSTFTPLSLINKQAPPEFHIRRNRTEDEYFDEEEEPVGSSSSLQYIPAPGSPSAVDDEDDPLDAFMQGIEEECRGGGAKGDAGGGATTKGVRDDIEAEDDEESYYRFVLENPNHGRDDESGGEDVEYDEDGNPLAPKRSKWIDPLPPIDHSSIPYQSFERNFYVEHEDITGLDEGRVEGLRKELGISVSGAAIPKPVTSFAHLGLPEELLRAIRKSEFTQPTSIQAQGLPIALAGRDIIGIAKTGSGKTAAYVWPMLIHIADQVELKEGDGPIGIILCPTRELAIQIYSECKKFGKLFNVTTVCCYGGGSKYEQSKSLEAGAEIVVATPGRLIDLIKSKATNLSRVSYLVLDEADRMFDMGFEPQVNSICSHVRPDRQTLLFSATMRKKVEKLARSQMTDAVRVVQGDIGEANKDITQVVLVRPLGGAKWNWLMTNLVQFTSAGSVLIFVTKKTNAEELWNNLKIREVDALLLHGDMDQLERNSVISKFRKRESDILVATDVAARGLDIPHIRTVINFDVARDIDTHTHRVGRTGRAGEKGHAYTLVTEKDKEFAGHLVRNLESGGQVVSQELLDLAMKSPWFKKTRFKEGKATRPAAKVKVCRGLGYKETGQQMGGAAAAPAPVIPNIPNLPPGGPAAGRLTALKAAFKQQYCKQFTLSEEVGDPGQSAQLPPPPPPQDESKKKKSRWGD